MQSRAVRLTLLSLLLLVGVAGAVFTWDTYRRTVAVIDRERQVDTRLDRMSEAAAALGAAQQAYIAPGQQRGEWLSRATSSVQQLYDEAAALRAEVQAPDSPATLRGFAEMVDVAVKADDRARENLRVDQELIAADIVYTEARQSVDAMTTQLHALRKAEDAVAKAEQQALLERAVAVLGGCALLWLLGLVVLARTPARIVVSSEPVAAPPVHDFQAPIMESFASPVVAEAADRSEPRAVDLGAAADVCTELSRLADSDALPEVLARAANVLDANGIIVWLGAGEELFVAAAHGYPSDVASQLGPISRQASNATAAAWRKGELHLVPGTPMAYGALVAPLMRPDGCFGVLAAELRNQREHEPATQAVTTMIAAQLSSILAAGPAPSEADDPGTSAAPDTPLSGAEPHRAATA
jgi:hypothetical protein